MPFQQGRVLLGDRGLVGQRGQERLIIAGELGAGRQVDVQLPHRDDGITLIQTLSRRYLVVAMSIDGSSRAPALRAGAADFVEKNGNPDDILEALRRPLPPG